MKRLTPRQCAKILYELTQDVLPADLTASIAVFADFVRAQGMVKRIPHIIEAFVAYSDAKAGKRTIQVTTAHPLSKKIETSLREQFGSDVVFEAATDASLIGGAVIRDVDTIFDTSVRTQLSRLRTSLTHQS
jgi:F-type H+-transporting ATPase subunit delta